MLMFSPDNQIWLLMFVLIQQVIYNVSTKIIKHNYYLISYLFAVAIVRIKVLSRIVGRKIDKSTNIINI